ncbi:MAG: porin [Candidatus Tenebribacter mawsonii]|nr:porin [Candidatus Tenebribacter mawsonii]
MKKVVLLVFVLFAVGILAAETSTGNSTWDNGLLKWKSDDGMFETRMDVRIYIDYAQFMGNENDFRNGTMLRRARFGVKTKLWEDWSAELDFDFADNEVDAKDMWLRYDGLENSFLKFGQFKVPFSIEELTSSRLLTFLERAYPNLFAVGRRCGVGYTRWGSIYHISLAAYGQEFNAKETSRVDEAFGYGGRFALAPINNADMTLHFGGSAASQTTIDSKGLEEDFHFEPECKMGDTEIIEGGDILGIDRENLVGGEGAFRFKNFHLQGEYIMAMLQREEDLKDASFSGGYVSLSWILTGEYKPYLMDEGEFGKIIPKSNKLGAWELAARYSFVDMTDEDAYQNESAFNDGNQGIFGGKAANITFGLNWYPNPSLRFMMNYIMVDNSETADGPGNLIGNDDFSILSARFVVMY